MLYLTFRLNEYRLPNGDYRDIHNHGSSPLVSAASHHTGIMEVLGEATICINASVEECQ